MFDCVYDSSNSIFDADPCGDFSGIDALFTDMGMTPDPLGSYRTPGDEIESIQATKLA